MDRSNVMLSEELTVLKTMQTWTPVNSFEQELLKLNHTLKQELEQCYICINRLENDVKMSEQKMNMSVSYHDQSFYDPQSQQIIEKLNHKVNQKRHQVKKLQKGIQEMQQIISQIEKQKQDLKKVLQNKHQFNTVQIPIDNSSKLRQLQAIIGEQRNTIQLYSNQLNSKSAMLDKLYMKIGQLQKGRIHNPHQIQRLKQDINRLNINLQIKTQQNQGLKQSNNSLNNNIQQLVKQNNMNNQKNLVKVKQLQAKNIQSQNYIIQLQSELNSLKRNKVDLNTSFSSRISLLSGNIEFGNGPIARKITADQYLAKQRQEVQKQDLLKNLQQQIRALQNQKINMNNQMNQLKNDLVNIKIQHSNVTIKNAQLVQKNHRLQNQRKLVESKIEDSFHSVSYTHESRNKNINKTNNSLNRTITSNASVGSFPVTRFMTPNDGEIPVRDKNSVRTSNISSSNLYVAPNTYQFQNSKFMPLRKSTALVRTFVYQ